MSTLKTAALAVVLGLALTGCDTFTSTDTRLARAEKQMAEYNFAAAMIELKNVLQKEPENARAHLDMAALALQVGDASHADIELKKALELAHGAPFPKGVGIPDPVELDVRIRFALKKWREVLADIDANKLNLSPAMRALYRGQALFATAQIDEAQAEFQSALKLDPSLSKASIGMAQTYAFQGKPKEALETLDALTTKHPDNAEAWVSKAVILAADRRTDEAEKALEQANRYAVQLPPEQQARILATLTNAKLKRGDIDSAQKLYNTLAEVAGQAPIVRMLSAQLAVARKDYDNANAELQRLVKDAPDFVLARLLLADVLVKQNRLEQAEQQLIQAVQKAPDNLTANQMLAEVRQKLGRPAKSPSAGGVDPALLQAIEYVKRGEKDKAIPAFEKLAAANPKNPVVLNNLAWLYFEKGDARALETGRKAHELMPKAPEISDTYGWILFKSGRREEGLKLLKEAAAASKDPQIQQHYSEAQSTVGK